MPYTGSPEARFKRVEKAFAKDGFAVRSVPEPGNPAGAAGYRMIDGFIGVAAEHETATVGKSGRRKRAFYLEGDNRQMGYLLGLLAEDDVSRMTTDFVENVVFAFFAGDEAVTSEKATPMKELIVNLVYEASKGMRPDVPSEYIEELEGLLDGCKAANPATKVEWSRLWALNFGIDCALAHIYTGKIFGERGIRPKLLRTPIGCNAYSISGQAARGKHYFGRDFMFPTANVFQETACLIIYNPADRAGRPRHAFVSQSAPGIIGSMAAVSAEGVAIGVNMVPSRFCDPDRPGFNSLSLNRDCMEYCASAEEVVERIAAAQRGVSWLYPVADARGSSYIIEAGRKIEEGEPFPYFSFIPPYYRRRLPRLRYVERMRRRYGTPKPLNGLIARSSSYTYPKDYIERWNRRLYAAFDRNWLRRLVDLLSDLAGFLLALIQGKLGGIEHTLRREVEELIRGADYAAVDYSERGYINDRWTDANCPGPYYFAPQRETRSDVVLASNNYLSPEMRLTTMNEWTAIIASANQNDIQWRYDELNREILDALDASRRGIDRETAWELINFLRPDGKFPSYYNRDRKLAWQEVQVHGSVSLCELTERSIRSLYGYYGDGPVEIHLMSYL